MTDDTDELVRKLAIAQVQVIELTQALEQALATLRGIRDGYGREASYLRAMALRAVVNIKIGGRHVPETQDVAGPEPSST